MTPPEPFAGEVGLDRLAEVRAWLRTAARGLGADETLIADLVQVVDEWVTNVVVHAYGGRTGPLEVEMSREAATFIVRIRDRGPVFDPATAPAFDPSVPLERRPLGGMGIHLMVDLSDEIRHRARPGGGNEITIRRSRRDTGRDA